MKTIEQWLSEYGESHQNSTNKLLHWICVPLIILSLLGLLWSLPAPAAPVPINWAVVLIILAMFYYLLVSPGLAAGMLIVVTGVMALLYGLNSLITSLWLVWVAVFIIAWIGQFVGHIAEGKRPSFFKDVQFLLIGPLWLLSFIYRKLGIKY